MKHTRAHAVSKMFDLIYFPFTRFSFSIVEIAREKERERERYFSGDPKLKLKMLIQKFIEIWFDFLFK